MLSIGIDTVEIDRFKNWKNYPKKKLNKIFTIPEIDYCLSIDSKASERFASHFAAKEACYKAISILLVKPIPFLTFCKNVTVTRNNKIPYLQIDWASLNINTQKKIFDTKISLTHSKSIANAIVVIL